jgi:hypothetical protein
MNYEAISKCRISGSKNLVNILNLGDQAWTGYFPVSKDKEVPQGPLNLVWCPDSGLVQLGHRYESELMYGDNYGYRSGLNQSMVLHLQNKIRNLEKIYGLKPGATVLDIGSNDGTTLKGYRTNNLRKIGIDPTAAKFRQYYDADVDVYPEFFNVESFRKSGAQSADIVTSIAMFYDLEDPIKFAQDVEQILSPNGVWHFEQSYLPLMINTCSYDTICHEHVSYYSLKSIQYIMERANLKIVDVTTNAVNGGSFALTVARHNSRWIRNSAVIDWMLQMEESEGYHTPRPYRQFEVRVYEHRKNLRSLVSNLIKNGKIVAGYGASTKGNVLLQFCGFDEDAIPAIAEVNPDKFGCYTPGTKIPILSESDLRSKFKPDYFLVLPWHFRGDIVKREQEYLENGGKFIFPFPEIQIV